MTSISTPESKKSILHRYPLGSFFALAYLFFLIAILIIGAVVSLTSVTDFSMGLLIAAAAWTPNLAAVVVTRVTDGKSAIKGLFAGWMQWRVNPGWYLFGLAPLLLAFVSAGLNTVFGGSPAGSFGLTTSSFVLMLFFHTIQGATGEELGWRGFALPRLQSRFSSLTSALILGLLVAGWHGLLHLVSPTGIPEWQFWGLMVSYSIIVTWAFNQTRGSVFIVTLFHFAFNFSLELVSTGLGLIPLENLFAIRTVIYTTLALGLCLFTGKNLSADKASL